MLVGTWGQAEHSSVSGEPLYCPSLLFSWVLFFSLPLFVVSLFITSINIIIFYYSLIIKMFLIPQVLPSSNSPPSPTEGLGCEQVFVWCAVTSWGSTRTVSKG